jgi:sugar diacid utilization regulator
VQARLGARNGVELGTVLQRYIAGYTLLDHLLDEEAEKHRLLAGEALQDLRRVHRALFNQVVAVVSDEHTSETRRWRTDREHRRTAVVVRLLGGERIDTSEIAYDFDSAHVGMIAQGRGTVTAIRGLATALDCRLLVVNSGTGSIWAWLGRREAPDLTKLEELVSSRFPAEASLAIGEIGGSIAGWRRSHQQARAALIVARRRRDRFVRYGNVPLLASFAQDELLTSSLRELFLAPLEKEGIEGIKLHATLRAYFAAGGNRASAAKALKVSRQTVHTRLQTVEDRLGRPLSSCAAELEAALRLDDLERVTPIHDLSTGDVDG